MSLHPRRVPDWVRDMREAIEYIHLDIAGLDRQAFEAAPAFACTGQVIAKARQRRPLTVVERARKRITQSKRSVRIPNLLNLGILRSKKRSKSEKMNDLGL